MEKGRTGWVWELALWHAPEINFDFHQVSAFATSITNPTATTAFI